MAETFLSAQQLSARYGVHPATIWRWAKVGSRFPKPVTLSGACTRWKLSELAAWEAERVDLVG